MPRNHNRSESENVCVVCCEDIVIFAVGQCDHPICYVCSVRMRVLGKEKYCAVCRTDLDKVLLTKKCGKWSTLQDQIKHGYLDRESGLCYGDKEVRNKVNELLQHKCPKCLEHPPERTLNKLRDHMKKEHHLYFCDICLKHLQKFTHELKVYSRADLAKHRRVGDPSDTAYKGHPICEFCDERFLDDDYLHRHLCKNHFWCHICEKDGKQLYFQDYVNLRDHFRDEHFLCEEDMCKYEQYTSVFRSEIDLQAHIASKHSQKMTKAQVRQARQLEVDLVFNRPSTQGWTVTGQDYNEVQAGEQRFRRNRGKGRNTSNTRQEDKNVQAAIEKSLAKTEDNPSSHQNKTSENPTNESKQALLPEGDFPLLNGEIPAPQTSQNSSPKPSPNSTRKTEAYIKKAKGLNNLEDFPVLDGNTSKVQQNGVANNVPNTKQFSPKSTRKIEKPNKKAKSLNNLDDFPTLEKSSKAQKNGANDVKTNIQSSPKTTRKPEGSKKKPLDNNDDFPTLEKSSKPQQNTAPVSDQSNTKVSKPPRKNGSAGEKNKSLGNVEDFPSLGKPTTSQPNNIPPGFSLAAKGPSETSQIRPPPGFMSSLSSQPQQITNGNNPQNSFQFSEKVDDIHLPKEKPKAVTNNEKKDSKPDAKDNQLRNQNLIGNVKVLLNHDAEKFVQFKQLSGKFRQGQCSAEAYYNDCTALFGPNFALIFHELVTLLPDHEKQKELLRIYNDAKVLAKQNGEPLPKSGGKKLNALDSAWGSLQSSSAPVKKEGSQKTRNEMEFPSLPPAAPRQIKAARIYKPTNNLALKSAWVRGK